MKNLLCFLSLLIFTNYLPFTVQAATSDEISSELPLIESQLPFLTEVPLIHVEKKVEKGNFMLIQIYATAQFSNSCFVPLIVALQVQENWLCCLLYGHVPPMLSLLQALQL